MKRKWKKKKVKSLGIKSWTVNNYTKADKFYVYINWTKSTWALIHHTFRYTGCINDVWGYAKGDVYKKKPTTPQAMGDILCEFITFQLLCQFSEMLLIKLHWINMLLLFEIVPFWDLNLTTTSEPPGRKRSSKEFNGRNIQGVPFEYNLEQLHIYWTICMMVFILET